MGEKQISRREFVGFLGVSSAAAILNACTPLKTNIQAAEGVEPDLELALRAIPGSVPVLEGAETRVWRYEGEVLKGDATALQTIPGSYLGPIIRARKGQNVRVHFTNQLPEDSIVHWHGLHVPESADGHPRLAVGSGEKYQYDFTVMDRAGMYWFHPHPHGRTATQVMMGLAGLFIVTDETEDALGLSGGDFDLPLVIQDRTFDSDNQFVYDLQSHAMTGFFGDRALVNGVPDYQFSAATRPYRLRLLNGSNARVYALAWSDGSPLTVIGTDGGLLEKAETRDFLLLAPAERRDVWLDLSERNLGDDLTLVHKDPARPGSEETAILTINVEQEDNTRLLLPDTLSMLNLHEEEAAVNVENPRAFNLSMGMGMRWLINGKQFEMTAVDKNEAVKLGDVEVWEFFNEPHHMMGNLYHPMHIHGLQFQILERSYDTKYAQKDALLHEGQVDAGWHDTVLVLPGERVRLLMKFEHFEGLYLYHCHTLEHEDMGMMRNYRVSA